MKTTFYKGILTVIVGMGGATSSYGSCNTERIVGDVLDVAAIIGTVNTAVNVSQAVIRPLAEMWSDPDCQAELGVTPEEARIIAQEVVVNQERQNIQETLRRASAIMNDYNQQCRIGQDEECVDYVVSNGLRDAENLASTEDNAIAHGFLLADTLEALVANRLSLLTLWAKASVEQNERTQALSEEALKNQIKSVFQNRLGLSYTRLVEMVQNYQKNIGWVLNKHVPLDYKPKISLTGEFKGHRYCYFYRPSGKSGCSSVRDKRKKARRQADQRRLADFEFDLDVRDIYFGETYRNLLVRVSQATSGFDSFYEQIRY